jgi:hypothetical protein
MSRVRPPNDRLTMGLDIYCALAMPNLIAAPQLVIGSILGSVSVWLIVWLVTRRRPKHLPLTALGIVFAAEALSIANQHPNWPDAQAASPIVVAVTVGLVVCLCAYWLLTRSSET